MPFRYRTVGRFCAFCFAAFLNLNWYAAAQEIAAVQLAPIGEKSEPALFRIVVPSTWEITPSQPHTAERCSYVIGPKNSGFPYVLVSVERAVDIRLESKLNAAESKSHHGFLNPSERGQDFFDSSRQWQWRRDRTESGGIITVNTFENGLGMLKFFSDSSTADDFEFIATQIADRFYVFGPDEIEAAQATPERQELTENVFVREPGWRRLATSWLLWCTLIGMSVLAYVGYQLQQRADRARIAEAQEKISSRKAQETAEYPSLNQANEQFKEWAGRVRERRF